MMADMSVPWMALPSEDLRLRAVKCVEEGEAPQDVAQLFDVSERSVWRWLAAWRHDGVMGLSDRPRPGRPPRASGARRR